MRSCHLARTRSGCELAPEIGSEDCVHQVIASLRPHCRPLLIIASRIKIIQDEFHAPRLSNRRPSCRAVGQTGRFSTPRRQFASVYPAETRSGCRSIDCPDRPHYTFAPAPGPGLLSIPLQATSTTLNASFRSSYIPTFYLQLPVQPPRRQIHETNSKTGETWSYVYSPKPSSLSRYRPPRPHYAPRSPGKLCRKPR